MRAGGDIGKTFSCEKNFHVYSTLQGSDLNNSIIMYSHYRNQRRRVGDPEYVPRFSGDKQELVPRWDTFQYVPLLSTLSKLIQDPDI